MYSSISSSKSMPQLPTQEYKPKSGKLKLELSSDIIKQLEVNENIKRKRDYRTYMLPEQECRGFTNSISPQASDCSQ